jgi:ABC-type dipeptide/oligopeptide/nickel transport system permease component
MLDYAIKRIGLGFLILIVTMTAMYAAVFLIPGDPAAVALGPRATPEMKRLLWERMGLDQPFVAQLWNFFANALRGDLGVDVWSGRPVGPLVLSQLRPTLALTTAAIGWAFVAGVTLGCLSVLYRDSLLDRIAGVLSVGFIAVPSFVVAIYALLLFSVELRWFPAIGAGRSGDIGSQLQALVLPAFSVGLGWVGYLARMLRASLLEVMGEGHVRTARAFGVPEWRVVSRYALRVAIVPTISLLAVGLGGILSSSVFVEVIFGRPGIGSLSYEAVLTRNYPVVMGAVLVTTALYVLVQIVADLVIAMLDPRVRDAFRA